MRRRARFSVEEDFNFEKCGGWGLEGDVSCQNGREYKPIQFKLSTLLFIFPRRLMVNSSKKRTKHAPHSFHITGIPGKFIKEDVEVSFKPLPKKKIDKPRSIRPTFNHDRKFYTLAFRLPSAEVDPDEQALKEHERRVMEAQLEIEDIMYPKPRSKQKYCGVCKDYYEDYKEHVQSEPHITNLRRSPYQRLIKQTAQKLAEQVCDRRFEEEKTLDSTSEDQLFKCLSIETITEPTLTNKRTPEVAAE